MPGRVQRTARTVPVLLLVLGACAACSGGPPEYGAPAPGGSEAEARQPGRDASPAELRGLEIQAEGTADADASAEPAPVPEADGVTPEPSPALVAALEQALAETDPAVTTRRISAALAASEPANVAALDSELRFEAHWVLDSIGVASQAGGKLAAAREDYRMALALAEFPEDQLVVLNRLALLQKSLGRPDSAVHFLREAVDVAASETEPSEDLLYFLNGTYSNLGLAFDEWNRPDSALRYHRLALEGAADAQVTPDELALTLNNLGVSWRRAGEPDSALAYYDRADALGMPDQGLLALNRGLVYGDMGNDRAARAALDSALALRSGEASAAGMAQVQRHLAGLVHRVQQTPEESLPYYASAAASLDRARVGLGGDADLVSWGDLSGNLTLYSDWADALLDSGESDAGAIRSLGVAERGRAQALKWMLRSSAGDPATEPGSSAGAPLDLLQANGMAALIYDSGPEDLRIWTVRPNGVVQAIRCPVGSAELGALVEAYREELVPWGAALTRMSLEIAPPRRRDSRRRTTVDNRFSRVPGQPWVSPPLNCPTGERQILRSGAEAGASLTSLLIPADFLADLPDAQPLLVIPSGDLTLLPFAALPTGEGPLGHVTALSFAPSLEIWAMSRTDPAAVARPSTTRGTAVVVADPTMPVEDAAGARWSLAQLPGARREGASISELLGVRPLSGDDATESTFVASVADADVIHIATHGVAYGEPSRSRQSFLAFAPGGGADGFLSVDEVLDPEAFPSLSARLVVLSACQTGLGEVRGAEGTVGLQRAFLARGAQAVLVSLWSVSDEGTYELITRFYRYWLSDGLAPAEALRRAQESLAEAGFAPADWAAFQIYGQG